MCVLPYEIHAAGLLHCQTFGLDGCDTLDQAATDGGDMSAAVCGDRKKKAEETKHTAVRLRETGETVWRRLPNDQQ